MVPNLVIDDEWIDLAVIQSRPVNLRSQRTPEGAGIHAGGQLDGNSLVTLELIGRYVQRDRLRPAAVFAPDAAQFGEGGKRQPHTILLGLLGKLAVLLASNAEGGISFHFAPSPALPTTP
ncbi:hypothetical protein D3C77_276020 [compost metagenome]